MSKTYSEKYFNDLFNINDSLERLTLLKEQRKLTSLPWSKCGDNIFSAGQYNNHIYIHLTLEDNIFYWYSVTDGKEEFWDHYMEEKDIVTFEEIFES